MSDPTEKTNAVQKPFRCTAEFDSRLNRAKGALMIRTGSRISDNQFFLELLELGLAELLKRIENNYYGTKE